jgi:hypothetical protein
MTSRCFFLAAAAAIAMLSVIGAHTTTATAEQRSGPGPTPLGALKITNDLDTPVRVRLVSFFFASRDPIDIKKKSSVSLPRIAVGQYAMVVHSMESEKLLLATKDVVKVEALGTDPKKQYQTVVTLQKYDERGDVEARAHRERVPQSKYKPGAAKKD